MEKPKQPVFTIHYDQGKLHITLQCLLDTKSSAEIVKDLITILNAYRLP